MRNGKAQLEVTNGNHLEMFALDGDEDSDPIVWQMDDYSMSKCATAFLRTKVWDGMDFYQAEREIEWVG